MIACSQDIISFSKIYVETYEKTEQDNREAFKRTEGITLEERKEDWGINASNTIALMQQLGAAYKALFFFIRSLQDSSCALLIELEGNKSGRYTSMNQNCYKRPDSSIHKLISKAIPNYFDWFSWQKHTRDKMKEGISQGSSFSEQEGLAINFHVVRENGGEPNVEIEEKVRIRDLTDSIKISNELLQLIETEIV